jgi:acyl-coenzyme A thioesterase PaaI-like protein
MKQFEVPLGLMNFYPPLVGAGIRIKAVSPAHDRVVVEMKLTWWNANFARTHFGGSLYMMIDPFYALMLKHQLGPGYVVWDREATIHFRAPGRSKVRAVFELPPDMVAEYRAELNRHGRLDVVLPIEIHDANDALIAEASKVIYMRHVDASPPASADIGSTESNKPASH